MDASGRLSYSITIHLLDLDTTDICPFLEGLNGFGLMVHGTWANILLCAPQRPSVPYCWIACINGVTYMQDDPNNHLSS